MKKIALIQQPALDDLQANRAKALASVEEAAAQGANIVCFAELAFDPFWPQVKATDELLAHAEPIPGPTTDAFAELARKHQLVIILNLFERVGDKTFDSSPVIDADGSILGITRMVHIADLEGFFEQGYYAPGDQGAPVYDTAHGRIGVAICYDRHYPEYMRTMALNGAQLVVTPQAGAVGEWPDGLYEAEMRVAAFQNGYFTALCNRVGPEPHLTFAGKSFVCDPMGQLMAQAGEGTDEILYCDMDLDQVATSPAREMFLRDRRPELYGDWLAR